jgi:hypothetical protein
MTAKGKTARKNEVALTFTSNQVPDMIKVLEDKLAAFDGISESNYRTSGQIDGLGDIKTMTDLSSLIRANGMIMQSEEYYNQSAQAMGLDKYPQFSYKGNTAEDWKKDIKLRYDLINQKETIDKLNHFKSKLETFLSEEDKKNMLLKEMEAFAKSL